MHDALQDSTPRTLLHTRKVDCNGYRRADGLYDIEARMIDVTARGTELPFRLIGAGEEIHDMWLLMTIDRNLVIRRMIARTDIGATPYCAEINSAYAALEGLKIGPGFRQKAKALVAGARGCTHLTELLGPLATTAMQTIMSESREARPWSVIMREDKPVPRPFVIGTCHAYREDGPGTATIWPPERREDAAARRQPEVAAG